MQKAAFNSVAARFALQQHFDSKRNATSGCWRTFDTAPFEGARLNVSVESRPLYMYLAGLEVASPPRSRCTKAGSCSSLARPTLYLLTQERVRSTDDSLRHVGFVRVTGTVST